MLIVYFEHVAWLRSAQPLGNLAFLPQWVNGPRSQTRCTGVARECLLGVSRRQAAVGANHFDLKALHTREPGPAGCARNGMPNPWNSRAARIASPPRPI